MANLSFDKLTHSYFIGGRKLPGVTSLLKRYGWIDDSFYNEVARDRGRAVHESIELIAAGKFTLEDFADTEIFPYLQAYTKFLKDSDLSIISMEQPVHYGKIYAGKYDIIGKLGRAKTLIDIKTGGPACWHGLQLEFYAQAAPYKKLQKRNLYLTNEGKYKLSDNHPSFGNYQDKKWNDIWRGIVTNERHLRMITPLK